MTHHKTLTALLSLWTLAFVACATPPRSDATTQEPLPSANGPQRRALLIGINDYSASAVPPVKRSSDAVELVPENERREWRSLEGAVNDVEGMREMLIGAYAFPTQNVRLLTDQEATRDTILRSIEEHLVQPSRKGDVVVFHYSGHGSYITAPESDELDKLDETIVPADSKAGALDIRDKELRRVFNRVLDKGANLVVILDSCYSGSAARGLSDGARTRALKPSPLRAAVVGDYGPRIESRGALVLSASQDDESAQEVKDENRRPHGAFTLALLRALRVATAEESAEHVFQRALAWLGQTGHLQQPALEGLPERLAEPLFGGRSDHRDGVTVISAEPYIDGKVRLLGGRVNGLAVGSELRRFGAAEDDGLRLQITELLGLTGSVAEIFPADRTVGYGELFELISWVAPDVGPLTVWMPSTTEPERGRTLARKLQDLAQNGKLGWIEDPTKATPSHVLRWRDHGFELVGPEGVTKLGAQPEANEVARRVSPQGRLFVQLPAPANLLEKMVLGADTAHSAVEPVDDPQATYYLVGRWHEGTTEFAWVRPQTLQEDRSQGLPVSSAWDALPATDADLDTFAYRLEDKALRLAKIHSWLNLQSPPGDTYPYRLAVTGDDGPVMNGKLRESVLYRLVVSTADGQPPSSKVEDRYVYAFSIDGNGNSSLLYPQRFLTTGNRVPGPASNSDGSAPAQVDLGEESVFDIVAPFGYDTFFLVTTDEPISDPTIFAYEGVRGDGPAANTALEKLLVQVGSTRRSARPRSTVSYWSIERKVFETVPKTSM